MWWTGEQRDDIFWRSSQSGGRATERAKKGLSTANSAGDIGALDPDGHTLLEFITFELKRGYKDSDIHQILDRPDKLKPCIMDQWFSQTINSAQTASTPFWMLMTRRDRKLDLIWIPESLYRILNHVTEKILYKLPNSGMLNLWWNNKGTHEELCVYFTERPQFFEFINREDVENAIEHYRQQVHV